MSGYMLKEPARLGILAVAAGWLLHPFATARMYGAGDALWYANMLADYVTQLRAGVFPVFAGQTQFAFNGAVYPLRVAPMYQHLAGVLDLLTARTLGFIALQHLAVIVCGVAGIYACYVTLCRVAPARRWRAVGFSILYLSCPGLLATIYTQDLYMTWMAVPLAPLAVYGIVRTFRADDVASQFWLAVPLAALWWAHSPIALWFTFIAAASQLVRLVGVRRSLDPHKRALLGAAIFAILAQYPFVSVAQIRVPGGESTVVDSLSHPEKIVEFVRGVFPGILRPLSDHARELADLQLGYAFWCVFIFLVVAVFSVRRKELAILLASAAFLMVLILPVPGINRFLWTHMPAGIVRITYYWPMQRFYLILAALITAAGQIGFVEYASGRRRVQHALSVVLLGGCVWSLWESRQFIRAASERTGTEAFSARVQRPENLFLMDHSYGLFSRPPGYFTNGVVDPRSEARLKIPITWKLLPKPERRFIQSGTFVVTVDANPGILELSPAFHLDFGRRYALEFAFAHESVAGILQFVGRSLFREYSLPSSGEAMAFGDGPNNGRTIDLWTSDPLGEEVRVRFIPVLNGNTAASPEEFGSFKLREIDPSQEPVEIVSLMPFQANTRAGAAAVLETPRVFMPGYVASVDGHKGDVLRSDEGLASVPVEPGVHTVSLGFPGPLILRFSYWTAILAWAVTLLFEGFSLLRPRN